jgi:hypothetical protein
MNLACATAKKAAISWCADLHELDGAVSRGNHRRDGAAG